MGSSGRRVGAGMTRRRAPWRGATLAWAVGLWAPAVAAQPAAPRVEVDAGGARVAVPRDVFGGNLEFVNENAPAVAELAGSLPVLRFPGGDADSEFRWDRALRPRCGRPGFDWPAAAALASRSGAGLYLETNILRSTPEHAARWVVDARRRGLRVAWVGVGNEVWGDWDRGHRSAARYAADVRAHARAIRARAPGTHIALSIGTFNEEAWNREAIRRTADVIDAVDYHYYPNHHEQTRARPEEVIAGAEGIAPLLARLRAMLRDEAGARAGSIQILFGEWDGASDPPPQSQVAALITPRAYASWSMADALFYGAALGEMITGGVAGAMFYEVQGYRFGAIPGHWCMPADHAIRRPKVLVHQLWREHFGDEALAVTTQGVPRYRVEGPTNWDGYAGEVPRLRAYASLAAGGRELRLILVNRADADVLQEVELDLRGFVPQPDAQAWEVGGDLLGTNENVGGPADAVVIRTRAVRVDGPRFRLRLTPWSVTALTLRRGAPPAR